MLVLDTDIGQYEWLKLTGTSSEDEYTSLVCGLLDGNGAAIDVGASFGCWTLALANYAAMIRVSCG